MKSWHPSNWLLRGKIVLIVTLAVAVYTVGDHVLQRMTLLPQFQRTELGLAEKELRRATEAINGEIVMLDQVCRARATSDRTWDLLEATQPSQHDLEVDLGLRTMKQDQLDLQYLCAPDGRVVWGEVRDWRTGQALQLRDLPRERLSPNHAYLVSENRPRGYELGAQRGYISGLVSTEHGPVILAARPVLHSDGSGDVGPDGNETVAGTLILGRFLNRDYMRELGERNGIDLVVWAVEDPRLPDEEREVLPRATASAQPVWDVHGDKVLDVYATLQDLRRAPAFLVRCRIPREIWGQAKRAVLYALLSTVASGLLMLLVLLTVLQRLVLSPIARLTAHAVKVGQTEDSSERIDLAEGRGDEVGILAREFQAMLEKLALSRAAVVETARRSGMSEIANGILHNVGNVLNSVNVATGLVAERVRKSSSSRLARVVGLVQEHQEDLGDFVTNDPRGKHLGPYLGELSRLMTTEQEEMVHEVSVLEEGIEHIRQLVSSHQAYAGRSGLREPVDVRGVLEDALRISSQASSGSVEVDVTWRIDALPTVKLDRHRLLEILVNLVKNAREAMNEVEGARRLLLGASCNPARTHVRIEVSDSGPGIAAADPGSVFQHGFTTKPGGHGFGLHSSANAAKEMEGALSVRSPGELGGATFVLELPLHSAPAPVATVGGTA